MILRPATIAFGVAASLFIASAGAVYAQNTPRLPDGLTTRQNLTPDDEARLSEYVGRFAQDLGSADPRRCEQARDRLLAPLAEGVSAGFRIAYSGELAPVLRDLVTRRNDGRVVRNALRLASALATDQAQQVIESALVDPRPTVRYAAAVEGGALLANVAQGRAAIPDARVDALIVDMRDNLANEPQAYVAQAFVLGLSDDDIAADEALSSSAMAAMTDGAAEWIKFQRQAGAVDPETHRLGLRAIEASQGMAFNVLGRRGGRLDQAFAEGAARVGGQSLAVVRDLLESGQADREEARLAEILVVSAENLVIIIHGALTNQQVQVNVASAAVDALQTPGAQAAARQAAQALEAEWIGPAGRLNRSPYDFPNDEFE